MKRDLFRFMLVLLLMVAFSVLIYPTLYHYDRLDNTYPFRMNRITGTTEVFNGTTWEVKKYKTVQSLKNQLEK